MASIAPGKAANHFGSDTAVHQALVEMNDVAFIVTMLPLGIMMAAVISILTMGYFLWIFLLAFVVFAVIALQYLVWGYWFERIYRSNLPPDDDLPPP